MGLCAERCESVRQHDAAATAIARYRTGATLLVDAGDTIQDNSADIFIGNGETHPMIQAINALNYDVWVTGNHEYNYGMDVLKKTIADLKPKVLTGNVLDSAGEPIADGYAIFDVDGVRVCVIGIGAPPTPSSNISTMVMSMCPRRRPPA